MSTPTQPQTGADVMAQFIPSSPFVAKLGIVADVLDLVAVNATLAMAAQAARVLGHLTIVGVGNATLPVSFTSPPHECSVASPFWGSIPELIEVIALARSGKIKMLVEHFALEDAAHAYHLLHDGKIPGRAVITPNN